VISTIQQSWAFVKKQADIMLLMDVSGSMQNEDKITQAIGAAQAFLDNMEPNNRVGLAVFSDSVSIPVPLGNYESISGTIRTAIAGLRANGGTELFSAVTTVSDYMDKQSDDRIRAIVLLSDGADTGDEGFTLNDAVTAIEASSGALNPIILIPVAYGSDADINALNALARSSNTSVQSGDASTIQRILEIISSYF